VKDGLFGISGVVIGALAVGLSVAIVLGSIVLAFAEGGQTTSIASFPTLESVDISPTSTPTSPPATATKPKPTQTPTNTPTQTPTLIPTASTESVSCDPPQGWESYTVQNSDTLNKLSEAAGLSAQQLADANCLTESRLVAGSTLFLPGSSPTAAPTICGAPSNWVVYVVQSGDTLFKIAQRVNSTVNQLIYANCLSSDKIRTGQELLLPYLPPPIPSPTLIPSTKPPPSPTSTLIPTATPTDDNISYRPPPYPYPPP
jgi:LysM repeat protein